MNALIDSLLSLHARYPGFFAVLASSFKATALFSLAWFMVQVLAHRSARARNWVWRLTLAMLLVLAGWIARPAPFADFGLAINVTDHLPVKQDPPLMTLKRNAAETTSDTAGSLGTADENAMITVQPHPVPPMPAAAARKVAVTKGWPLLLRRLDDRMTTLWLLGFLLMAFWKTAACLMGRWWLCRSSEAPPASVQAFCPAELGCQMSSRVRSPVITGWLKSVVWLPTEAAAWDDLKLRAAFQHERAHHLRRDGLWQALGTLAACAWWWMPLSWIALRKMKAEAEHAADDLTVTQSLTVPDYAEALVQIARGSCLASPGMRVGIAMSGYSDLEQRVRSLLRNNPWRDRLGALASAAMVIMMISMSTVVLVGCKTKPPQYVSLAKLVAGGRMVSNIGSGPQYQEYLQDFYGTVIETLESAEMRRHALERVRALNPDLKEADVDIHVTQNKGSAIFNVAAIGTDPKFTRVFLDALLDEFRAFREQIREQQRNKALTAMAEDVVKREAANKEKAEKLEAFKKTNNVVVLTNSQSQTVEILKQVTLDKNHLLLELTDIEQSLKDVEASVAQRRMAAERSPSSSASGGSASPMPTGLTRSEMDYLNARSELTVCKVDMEVLSESKTPDAAKLDEAKQRKARLEKLLRLYVDEITESLKARKADVERRVTLLDERIDELAKQVGEVGAKLAEFARLTKDFEDSDKAYKEMFDVVHKFQVNEEMGGDYVTIMERASAAVEDVKPWWSL